MFAERLAHVCASITRLASGAQRGPSDGSAQEEKQQNGEQKEELRAGANKINSSQSRGGEAEVE